MPFDPERHHRRSIRLQGYDYALAGAYFMTICTYGREPLFGEIVDGVMHPNLFGQVVRSYWERIPHHAPNVVLDAFVVMPNHVHGIITLAGNARRGEALAGGADASLQPPLANASPMQGSKGEALAEGGLGIAPTSPANASPLPQATPHGTVSGSLGAIVQNWKALTSRRINRLRDSRGAVIWQEGFYERVIRNERELGAIRQYIADNPAQWSQGAENPAKG